jgi:DNA-binding transcriptional ArsR family regulator
VHLKRSLITPNEVRSERLVATGGVDQGEVVGREILGAVIEHVRGAGKVSDRDQLPHLGRGFRPIHTQFSQGQKIPPQVLEVRSSKDLFHSTTVDIHDLTVGDESFGYYQTMNSDVDIAAVAALFGDRTRAAFLEALGEVESLPLSDLALRARVSVSTASVHMNKLAKAGLVHDQRHGRHRYFRLASPDVADAIEALSLLAPEKPVRSLRDASIGESIRAGRTCYDHLAGRLGVGLTAALERRRLLRASDDNAYVLTSRGRRDLTEFGMDMDAVAGRRRVFARRCLDWSEQRYHLAGALGAALTEHLFALGWLKRFGTSRAVRMTSVGLEGLDEQFGLRL